MQLLQWRLSSPKAATHLPGFLVFREARSRKLDTTAEHQAAFDDEENLTKEVEKYNQSIIERRAVSLDQKAYVPGSCVFHLSNAAEQAGLYKDFFWDNPGFWFGLFSDELMEMFAHTRQTFADDKEQALIAPQDDVEVYERMSLFKAVVEIAVEAQKAYLVFEDNLSEDDLSEDD
ncbi:MAG: hypothetical protein FRX48_02048 [Lasallia pustulata]|uniref:Uncharacterized protein n=1 Tax=Lasallia pustulata TaxID=136370 RepID=A0A5M8PVP2_9LECA|nr:MAG: hypothetical protein FRX48_02048 [Lasallia pustulata]